MNKFVKALACVFAFVLAAAIAGCASGNSASSASASASQASASASAASSQASASAEASSASASSAAAAAVLENDVYSVEFNTDSSMFHVNEANKGRGELNVSDDGMTVHVSLASKKIVNLYVGKAADAEADAANVIEPTVDTVKYDDGTEEEVFGFDIPVPALDEEFDVAILGEKGKWYDHKVSVSDPQPIVEGAAK